MLHQEYYCYFFQKTHMVCVLLHACVCQRKAIPNDLNVSHGSKSVLKPSSFNVKVVCLYDIQRRMCSYFKKVISLDVYFLYLTLCIFLQLIK